MCWGASPPHLRSGPSDSAGRKPSEIPSRTQSVSAFLPGRVSPVCFAPPVKSACASTYPFENNDEMAIHPFQARGEYKVERGSVACRPIPVLVAMVPTAPLGNSFRGLPALPSILVGGVLTKVRK